VTEYIIKIVMFLVTPKAAAKQELLFNKPASEASSLNIRLCLAAPLGVTEFMTYITMILVLL
jgi:hypothetical protein